MAKKVSKLQQECYKYRHEILQRSILAIDPAIGEKATIGWAFFSASELSMSGTISLPKGTLFDRLRFIVKHFQDLEYYASILAIEQVAIGRIRNNSLIAAYGCIIGAVHSNAVIPVPPASWRALVNKDYIKSDENDAIAIGRCLIHWAEKSFK